MKKDSKTCNFRLTTDTVKVLADLAATWACSQTEAVTRALLIAEAAVHANAEPVDEPLVDTRYDAARAAMADVEAKPPEPPAVPRRAESVAQRRARETKEHAEKLAQSDVLAQMTGRNDIEYDLENVPHQSAFNVALQTPAPVKHHYDVQPRKVKPLTRPNGTTEAKRRREQG